MIYTSIPWVVHESMAGLIECAVAFYGLAATMALAHWFQIGRLVGFQSDWRWQIAWPSVGGFLAGATAACKYPGVVFVAIPLFAWMAFMSARKRAWKPVIAFAIAAGCGCGLWYAKNWALTGNPTYPLLYSVFGGESRTVENDQQWRTAHQVPRDYFGRSTRLASFGRR